MKAIIAGSRRATLEDTMMAINDCSWVITSVVSGLASGPDTYGLNWAIRIGLPVSTFAADWFQYGKRAGAKRNTLMADNAEALIAVWDGKSRGTENMINIAKIRSLKVHIHYINQQTTGVNYELYEREVKRSRHMD